jgi:hypothetical protein
MTTVGPGGDVGRAAGVTSRGPEVTLVGPGVTLERTWIAVKVTGLRHRRGRG